jgi:hypothetical protein
MDATPQGEFPRAIGEFPRANSREYAASFDCESRESQ